MFHWVFVLSSAALFYVFTQTFHSEQDVTQGQFLSEVQLIWIQRFPSPRLVA